MPPILPCLQVAAHAWPGVPEALLTSLVNGGDVVTLSPGQPVLVGPDAPVQLLLSGIVGVGNDVEGTLRLPRTYVGGCVLNEERHLVEFLRHPDHNPADTHPPAGRAVLKASLVNIPDEAYLNALDSKAFLRATARRLKIEERVSNRLLTYQAAGDRDVTLARMLVFLIDQGGSLLNDHPMLNITQQQMAEICCLSIRHVNSSLKALEMRGLIERFKGGFLVLDDTGLFRKAGHHNMTAFDRKRLEARSG